MSEHIHDDNCKTVMAIRNTNIDAGCEIFAAAIRAAEDRARVEGRRLMLLEMENDYKVNHQGAFNPLGYIQRKIGSLTPATHNTGEDKEDYTGSNEEAIKVSTEEEV